MTSLLGIDLGTSQVKALACAPDGTVLGQGSARYDIAAPRDGWAESDPGQWWRAVRTAVRAAAPAEVAAIAITGQMHGVILTSQRAVVLRPAILWLDRRASGEVPGYENLRPDQLRSLANAPWPGTAGPILRWLARHEPDVYRAARWQFQPKDWLRFVLTGEPATDPTDASGTLLYDMIRDDWSPDVASALGVRPDLLAPVRGPAEVAGLLRPVAAAELGLMPGVPVVTGCADTAASLLAADLPGPDWALLTLGTGGQWIVPVAEAEPDPSGHTNLFRAVAGRYRLGGAQNVGVTLDWVRRTLGVSWDDLYGAVSRSARPPVFRPWLVDERGNSGAGWTGLTLAHGRDDLLHAALTGVAGVLRDRLADLRAAGCAVERVRLGGGGSRHPAWRELLSQVLGVPLYPTALYPAALYPTGIPSLTVRGATLLAAQAAA